MPTIAQKKAMQERQDKSARRVAYATIGVMLSLSTAANVLTAWDYDLVSKIVAGVPPVSLFITSTLYERMRATLPIKIGMILTIVVSLAFSWVHIAELAYTHHQHIIISILLPVIIDVPMLFAGTIIINQSSVANSATISAAQPRTHTAPTKAPMKSAVSHSGTRKAPSRKLTTPPVPSPTTA